MLYVFPFGEFAQEVCTDDDVFLSRQIAPVSVRIATIRLRPVRVEPLRPPILAVLWAM